MTRFMRFRSLWKGTENVMGSEPISACVIIRLSLVSSKPRARKIARAACSARVTSSAGANRATW